MRNKNPLVKPFVKWAGGKRQILSQIKDLLPNKIKDYYEPFVGGGAVFLNLQRNNVNINDFNEELINSYISVRDNVNDLISLLKYHESNNSSEYYYSMRDWDRNGKIKNKTSIERASRFIYLNKTGFNGLFRVNSQGQINVPYGRYKHPSIVNEEILIAVSNYLNKCNINITSGDYYNAIQKAKAGDFVYLDPPYAPVSDDKKSFVGYTLNGFSLDDQIRLKNVVDLLTKRKVNVMLSNSNVTFIRELYRDDKYNINIVKAKRNINSNGKNRGNVDEVIIRNYI